MSYELRLKFDTKEQRDAWVRLVRVAVAHMERMEEEE